MQYAVVIDRETGAPTAAASSPDIDVYVIRDASISDEDLLADFRQTLAEYLDFLRETGRPIPQPHHRVAAVSA